jgi:hypothetical protein
VLYRIYIDSVVFEKLTDLTLTLADDKDHGTSTTEQNQKSGTKPSGAGKK